MISFRELVRTRYVRRGVIVFAVMTAALGSGVAYAAWTSSGNGSATTKAGTAQAPVVSGGAVTTGLLYPTGTASGTASVVVQNPNSYPVVVVNVAPNGPVPAVGGCGQGTVTFTAQAPGTAIAAGGTATITLPNSVAMLKTAADACQGVEFGIPVTVTIASA
jgi:hypothetical protein